jgi:ParB-like chromosome segregation protein Spo0J
MKKLLNSLKEIIHEAETLTFDEKIEFLNKARKMLHEDLSPFKNQPVDFIEWVPAASVVANAWNPNKCAPPEFELLKLSIREDGFTMPIVSYTIDVEREVVDGFHRSKAGKEDKQINLEVYGYLPVSTINKPTENRIASTIRHNRARGTHDIDLMSDLVAELHKYGKSDQWIAKNLGMDADEVLRLKQVGGLADLFRNKEFSQSWDVIESREV